VKKLRVSIVLLFALSTLLLLYACAKKQVTISNEAKPAVAGQKAPPAKTGKTPLVNTETAPVLIAGPSGKDLFESERIYFDFDNYDLQPQARKVLEKKAEWLQLHPDISIIVEGHCDERGTEDYNLALGQRRAEAAMFYLASLGISNSRIRTISYGELRPAALDHNEKSWSRNRRDEFKVSK